MQWFARLIPHTRTAPPRTEPAILLRSAAVAALAPRSTGPGSGPDAGTPGRPAAVAARRAKASAAVAGSRHDHGIIDHSRHVSSVGRR